MLCNVVYAVSRLTGDHSMLNNPCNNPCHAGKSSHKIQIDPLMAVPIAPVEHSVTVMF